MLYETIFPCGVLGASLMGILLVPRFGWQSMFILGGIPALLIAGLVWRLPESPRWLIGKNRIDEAEKIIAQVEAATPVRIEPAARKVAASAAPGKTKWSEVLSPFYRRRTIVVWILWASTYFVYYGIGTWLPSLYRTVYHLSVTDSLRWGSIANILQVLIVATSALFVDKLGRKLWFGMAFLVSAVLMLSLALLGAKTPESVVVLGSLTFAVLGSNATMLYLYTPEIYPTRMRAAGTGLATSFLRAASAAGPFLVGFVLKGGGIAAVFYVFAAVTVIGLITTFGATETRRRQLEEINP